MTNILPNISYTCKLNTLSNQHLSKAKSFPLWSALLYSIKVGRINCSDFISLLGSYPHNPALDEEEKTTRAQRQLQPKIVTNSFFWRGLDYFTQNQKDAVQQLKVGAASKIHVILCFNRACSSLRIYGVLRVTQ